jgi:hypothetical protein
LEGKVFSLIHANMISESRDFRVVMPSSAAPTPGQELPPVLRLPCICEFASPAGMMQVPSLLQSLETLHGFNAETVFLATPGSVGLTGLLAGKLLNARITGVFDADHYERTARAINADSIANIYEGYTRWFYSMTDEIQVPDRRSRETLEAMGIDEDKIRVLEPEQMLRYFAASTEEFREYLGRGTTMGGNGLFEKASA